MDQGINAAPYPALANAAREWGEAQVKAALQSTEPGALDAALERRDGAMNELRRAEELAAKAARPRAKRGEGKAGKSKLTKAGRDLVGDPAT